MNPELSTHFTPSIGQMTTCPTFPDGMERKFPPWRSRPTLVKTSSSALRAEPQVIRSDERAPPRPHLTPPQCPSFHLHLLRLGIHTSSTFWSSLINYECYFASSPCSLPLIPGVHSDVTRISTIPSRFPISPYLCNFNGGKSAQNNRKRRQEKSQTADVIYIKVYVFAPGHRAVGIRVAAESISRRRIEVQLYRIVSGGWV